MLREAHTTVHMVRATCATLAWLIGSALTGTLKRLQSNRSGCHDVTDRRTTAAAGAALSPPAAAFSATAFFASAAVYATGPDNCLTSCSIICLGLE